MNFRKRLITILGIIIISVLVVPLILVHTVQPQAGMPVTLFLLFVLYPGISVAVGIIAGKDGKRLWFVPFLLAVLFWCFSSLVYETIFPIGYAVAYLLICAVSMVITKITAKR